MRKRFCILIMLIILKSLLFSKSESLVEYEKSFNSNGILTSYKQFEYDISGNIIKESRYDREGVLKYYYTYSYENGVLTERTSVKVFKKGDSAGAYIYEESGENILGYDKYYYDPSSGLLIREESFFSDGVLGESISYSYYNDGKVKSIEHKNEAPSGRVSVRSYIEEFKYKEGKLYRVDQYDINGKLISYSYRLYCKIESINEYVVSQSIVFKNDKYNSIDDEDFIFSWMTEYEYDEMGFLINKCSYDILTYIKSISGTVKYSYYE